MMYMTLHLRDDDCQGSHLIPLSNVTLVREHATVQTLPQVKRHKLSLLFASLENSASKVFSSLRIC